MREKIQTTLRRTIGLLLAFVIGLALLPQASYAATRQYDMSGLRMKTPKFKQNLNASYYGMEDSYTYKDTVKVRYPVVGYVDATAKITMTQNTFKSLVDDKLYRTVHVKVNYSLTKSAKDKLKTNAKKISAELKKSKYSVMYPFTVFVLDSKTGKVTSSTEAYGGISENYQAHQSKSYSGVNFVTAKEYTYSAKQFSINDDSSFIVGIASPNNDVLSKEIAKGGNSAFKTAKKFWDGKVALKKSLYYKKGQKSRSLWLKFYNEKPETIVL